MEDAYEWKELSANIVKIIRWLELKHKYLLID